MTDEWADSRLDLPRPLPARGRGEALRTELRAAIRSGRLPAGRRLPPSRILAADLGVARNTVADAYGRLAAEGWLETLVGSGTRVAAGRSADAAARTAAEQPTPRLDLRPGHPDLSSFPRAAWSRAQAAALADTPATALGYDDPRGGLELRTTLAGYLARARGVDADPHRIVLTTGFGDGVASVWQLLVREGARRLGVEELSLPPFRRSAEAAGLELVPVPIDEQGADAAGVRADALLVTPAHQFPTGVVLSAERRRALGERIAAGTLVVEDDYDGEFRFDRSPVGALQGLLPDGVVYTGTVSKTLAPGARLGWLVVPERMALPLAELRSETGGAPSVIEQRTLARLIDSGAYDHHVRRMRTLYRRRRDELGMRLDAEGIRSRGIAAGLHVVVELPNGQGEEAVIARAADAGLALDGLAGYAMPGAARRPPSLVVGYGAPTPHLWPAALEALAAVLAHGRPAASRTG
ncbi:MAG: PLP-dependent aminotransferase family protein [Micrococcales bacterium]|nr:PLP-dependent aminotransferase family protein [Micrococcales bacterium]